MTALAEKIGKEASALPETERASLARLLLSSLDGPADPDAEAAWDIELERRLRDVQAGTAKCVPAAEVFADIEAKYRR